MRRKLFPDCPEDQQQRELALYFDRPQGAPGTVGSQACFVAAKEGGTRLCGFAEVMLRSHAEGCWDYTADGSMGIAYLEAWWVDEDARGDGVGRALVDACEHWARAHGSPALASDAELENTRSQAAHAALGFAEVERAVHFVKKFE